MLQAGHWSEEEARLRQALSRIGALAYQKGYIVGADGNLSARQSDGSILITPAGAMKGFLEPGHMAQVGLDGKPVDDGPRPSSEVATNPPFAVPTSSRTPGIARPSRLESSTTTVAG